MTEWITRLIENMGYAGIALLMFLENLFPPIPSEVIMPLAGFTASSGETLNIYGVVASGALGSLLGASFWYAIGRWLGAGRLERWADRHGRWITLSGDDLRHVDRWFERRGTWAVFIGRLIPTIRTLISIPAGVFAMPFGTFLLFSGAGTLLWTAALAAIGYALGSQYEQVSRYLGPATTAVTVLIVGWYLYRVATFERSSGR